jgi:hypothetical protein
MPIDYSKFRDIAERAKKRGLIAHLPPPTKKKLEPPKQQTRRRTGHKLRNSHNLPRDDYHWAILKIACPSCGAAKGESCEPTLGLTGDIPVHASRIYDAERN